MTPTRRTPLPGLGWAKREDESSPLYGGNKVRKLQAIIEAARARGISRLVTGGAAGSHHVVATALHGAAAGLEVHAVLSPQQGSPDARAHLALSAAHCASVIVVPRPELLFATLRGRAEQLSALLVPLGGSSPEGMVGSIDLGVELAGDLRSDPASEVVVPFGSGGTAVGIAVGLALQGLAVPVRAVVVTPGPFRRRRRLRRLATQGSAAWARRSGHALPRGLADEALASLRLVSLPQDPGYGRTFPEARSAVEAGVALGLPLEETYSGRAFAHLLRHPPASGAAFVVTPSAALPGGPPVPRSLRPLLQATA